MNGLDHVLKGHENRSIGEAPRVRFWGEMTNNAEVVTSQGQAARYLSVDALRGFDVFWILGGDTLARSIPVSGARLATPANLFSHLSSCGDPLRVRDLLPGWRCSLPESQVSRSADNIRPAAVELLVSDVVRPLLEHGANWGSRSLRC